MHPVARKLSIFAELHADEHRAIERTFQNTVAFEPRATIAHDNDVPTELVFVLEGCVSRWKVLEHGNRQVLGLLLPGDTSDRGITILDHRDHGLSALSRCVVSRVTSEDFERLLSVSRRLRDAFQWSTLSEEAICREWLANIGQRPAAARMAHLFCEHFHRMRAIGLTDHMACSLPLTQGDLSETLALSTVHTNRALQALRASGCVEFRDNVLNISNLPELERLGGFDPAYLHLGARYRNPFRADVLPMSAVHE